MRGQGAAVCGRLTGSDGSPWCGSGGSRVPGEPRDPPVVGESEVREEGGFPVGKTPCVRVRRLAGGPGQEDPRGRLRRGPRPGGPAAQGGSRGVGTGG